MVKKVLRSAERFSEPFPKKDVWDFPVFCQTFFELRFSLGNEGKDGKNSYCGYPLQPIKVAQK